MITLLMPDVTAALGAVAVLVSSRDTPFTDTGRIDPPTPSVWLEVKPLACANEPRVI